MVKGRTLAIVLGLCSIAAEGRAQVDNSGVLDQALNQYRAAAESWQNAAQSAASTLFWSLAAISLAWTMGQLVLRRADIGEFFAELIRYLLFTGFWAWMLANGPTHAQLIVDSMVRLASTASAQNRLTPSGILDVGFHILDRALTQSTLSSPLISTVGIAVALGILVVLALAAVNMLVSLIACWIVAYGGLIILGFGGSRWTSDMAINYYRMVLSLGLQVLAMILLVGMGESFLRNYFGTLKQDVSLHELAVLLVVSLVLLVTVNRIPPLLGTLASGSSPQYALGGGAGTAAAMTAISTAGGLAAWSQATANTVAGGAARAALGAGSIAKAMASAAATGGTPAAMTALVDGFRAAGTDRGPSAGTATSAGSVFPAPATPASASGVAPVNTRSAPQQATAPIRRAAGGPPSAQSSAPRADAPGDQVARSKRDVARPARNPYGEAPADEPAGKREGESAKPSAREARGASAEDSPAGEIPSTHARTRTTSSDPQAAVEHGSSDASDSASKAGKLDPTVQLAEISAAHSANESTDVPMPRSGNPIPAGTFATPPTTASIASTNSTVPPPAAAAISATSPSGKATATVADATRATAVPQEIPFSTARDNQPAKHAPARVTSTESTDRNELPAAYSDQTSMDVEAEVAAFRDRD